SDASALVSVTAGTKTPARGKEKEPNEVIRPAFQLGFLGDLLLGMVAANALHLALASMVQYNQSDPEKRRTMYFTFLALGILTGYAGSSALSMWAKRMVNPSEVRSYIDQKVDEVAKDQQPPNAAAATGSSITALTERMTRFEWPSEDELSQLRTAAAGAKESQKSIAKQSVDELIALVANDFFNANNPRKSAANLAQDKTYLDAVFKQSSATKQQIWTARMLRTLLITCDGAASSRAGWFEDVQADLQSLSFSAGAPDQAAATTTLSIYAAISAEIGKPEKSRDWDSIEKRLALGNTGASKSAFDVAKTIVVYLKTRAEPDITDVAADPVPIFRLIVRMRAVPAGFLEQVINALPENDKRKEALTPFLDTPSKESSPKPSNAPRAEPRQTPAPTP
ncbi:MAG: hypothetical protein QOE73_150, partial [Verrucomicrobiota bacterium]